ncbi:hypothetical protein BD289DRAFT_435306 [Coniella lustricola]|uniref:Secreted protein n=1 Tax=Coniella lustricola TaxID=2025994 RepID=A0A2T3A6M4_9PEZI|nr:hypothetical protein BD289DRAFT_435306 [Coniella lustricola]
MRGVSVLVWLGLASRLYQASKQALARHLDSSLHAYSLTKSMPLFRGRERPATKKNTLADLPASIHREHLERGQSPERKLIPHSWSCC